MKARASCAKSALASRRSPGDHVIPLYTPECRQCKSLPQRQDQPLHRDPRDAGQGPDARRHDALFYKGQPIFHYMGCSTFSNFTVLPEIAVAKIRQDAPFQSSCYIGCGVTTGVGAVINTAKVQVGDNVVVFGLGGIGLNVIQGARLAGATRSSASTSIPTARNGAASSA
jgi:S-(hydroxymethyl)glutathione dehydrogenase/alcohol dehydrogenase